MSFVKKNNYSETDRVQGTERRSKRLSELLCPCDSRSQMHRAWKLFNIRLYATLCFNYFRWHRRMFSYGSVFELLIC